MGEPPGVEAPSTRTRLWLRFRSLTPPSWRVWISDTWIVTYMNGRKDRDHHMRDDGR